MAHPVLAEDQEQAAAAQVLAARDREHLVHQDLRDMEAQGEIILHRMAQARLAAEVVPVASVGVADPMLAAEEGMVQIQVLADLCYHMVQAAMV
jgi:hypothetical protein